MHMIHLEDAYGHLDCREGKATEGIGDLIHRMPTIDACGSSELHGGKGYGRNWRSYR